jgi:signal transduction histidine kinase
MSTDTALSLLSRYEALFELSGEINAATELGGAAQVLARRLKYVADVFSWRYCRVESDKPASEVATALVVDGHRGEAIVQRLPLVDLGEAERRLWHARKTSVLAGDELATVRSGLPAHFQKPDIVQVYVCPRFGAGELLGLVLFSKRRTPFNELDVRFLTLAAYTFHDKIYLLWEQQKRRELERAYLEQEIMLRHSEKLATLGRLSAGMAHEVNNPAAAALRDAEQLTEELARLEEAVGALARLGLAEPQWAALERYRARASEVATQPLVLDPLVNSEREEELETWLEERSVEQGWRLAPALVSLGLTRVELEELSVSFGPEQLPTVLTVLAQVYTTHLLLDGIRASTGRVSEIVKALRSYSYLDQAPVQSVDVHEGLEDTLVMLRSKLRDGITIRRDFAPALPRVEAHGRELNQVWTNLIDNAVYAMEGKGELTLRTYAEEPWVVVEVADNGTGIAGDIQDRIFDPFFTTKPPGEGTGLGLNISHNIVVQKHGGRIEVRSEPGNTCFRVRLPLKLERNEPLAKELLERLALADHVKERAS